MSPDDARRYIIAYDIPHDRRRARLAASLLSYGDRLQFSVFVVDCRPARLVRLEARIRSIIDETQDSVLVCDLGAIGSASKDRFRYIGVGRPVTPEVGIIV